MVSLVVEQLSDIRSNDVREFQPILERSNMFNISKIKLDVPRTASRLPQDNQLTGFYMMGTLHLNGLNNGTDFDQDISL